MAGTVPRGSAVPARYRVRVPAETEAHPATLRWAIWLLLGEAAALGLLTLYLVYEDVTATTTDLTSALLVTAFAAGGTVVLVLLARALGRRRPAARAPAIVLELMLLPVGYYMIGGGIGWLGIPLMLLGLLVCGLLLSPPTTRALGVG
jgi:peptidoglycan/LPS O-acetylase OafA/YrhL